jgi:hypothetical protein
VACIVAEKSLYLLTFAKDDQNIAHVVGFPIAP